MPFAITLRLDPVSAGWIEDLCRALAEGGIDSYCRDLGYGAHITLALYRDDAPVDVLAAVFGDITRQWQALPVTLRGIGIFPGPSSIVWAAPVVTRDLLACHAALHAALIDIPTDPHYRPDTWMPHVSLSGAIADPERAAAALQPGWQAMTGLLNQADLVHFPPVDVLRSHMLPT